ncbi:MAG: DUF2344 domain-containing protein [Oscillospiraceae bacterium]|nr:DUF2344 domain-containing protein [Oscillospiraceae bacterium]
MYEVRLWLEKTGRLKFVSHLDMFRLMQRAVRRAGIPLWYTEGFNPHPYISFLLALSLGVEGKREPVDIRIVGDMELSEIKDRLNSVFPEGLRVKEAALPFNKPGEIKFAEYEAVISKNDISAEELKNAIDCGGLVTQKSGKSGGKKVMKTVNVSEHIKRYSLNEDENNIYLSVILPAGSTFNLNPLQLIDAVCRYTGKSFTPDRAVRNRMLLEDLSEFR